MFIKVKQIKLKYSFANEKTCFLYYYIILVNLMLISIIYFYSK